MFFVGDSSTDREKQIKKFLHGGEPAVAILLAVAHFEWTVCRAVLFLSQTPNVELRDKMAEYFGLNRYKELWREEVMTSPADEPLAKIVKNWSTFKDAFTMRNRLIHGKGHCTRNMAAPKVKAMLQAAEDLQCYCASRGVDLYSRLPVRRKPKGKI